MSSVLEWALKYASMGWHVFPVNKLKRPLTTNGLNDASISSEQITKWWTDHPNAGIGVATGVISRIIVLDVDLAKEGTDENIQKIIQAKGIFPQTVICQTGGGGYHVYFSHPGEERIPNSQGFMGYSGVDIRGDGGYVVVPPTIHISGVRYKWETDKSPFKTVLEPTPDFIVHRDPNGAGVGNAGNGLLMGAGEPIADGRRNATLTSIAGLMRTLGMGEQEILAVLRITNQERCIPPLPDNEVAVIASHITKYAPRNTRNGPLDEVGLRELLAFEHSDSGFANMIVQVNLGTIKFDHTRGGWLMWRDHYWEADVKEEIVLRVQETSRMYKEATALIQDEDRRNSARKYARAIQNRSRIDAGLTLARAQTSVSTTHEAWNVRNDIVATPNGVVDLRSGIMRPGHPEEYMALHVPFAYDPEAACPQWEKFIHDIFNGDERICDFVQRALGYTLTGETTEQVMFMLVGRGANGKSTLLDTVHHVLGRYAYSAPFSTFERTQTQSAQSNDVAALADKRMVTSSEPNEGVILSESRVKHLTGGEAVSARFLHQEFFEFRPRFKIWLGVNHPPRVLDDSDGFWRRVRRIDFLLQFIDPGLPLGPNQRHKDPDLVNKLKAEAPGIFRWMVEGAMAWYKDGLVTPESVQASTDVYRVDSDPIHEFMSACCKTGDNEEVIADDLFKAYQTHSINRRLKNFEILSSMKFHSRMSRDYIRGDQGGRRTYLGISLVEGVPLETSEGFLDIRPARENGGNKLHGSN